MNDSTREQTDRRTQIDEWLAVRKRAGLAIDPDTAEVMWCWAQILDPYGVEGSLDEEYSCIGRVHFARNPGDDVWVAYNDLPEETQFRLR